jgi:hypothetical protein
VPKGDGGWRRIHHLSFPDDSSVNTFIPREFGALTYITFDEVVNNIVAAGRYSIIIKRDIKDAFRNIPVAISDQWLFVSTGTIPITASEPYPSAFEQPLCYLISSPKPFIGSYFESYITPDSTII